jgi:hypothetical protein
MPLYVKYFPSMPLHLKLVPGVINTLVLHIKHSTEKNLYANLFVMFKENNDSALISEHPCGYLIQTSMGWMYLRLMLQRGVELASASCTALRSKV